ncbi:hypothetical protein CPC16_011227 [Podila verticillata]|nr:hypothetical protein CPC16_011227 [Podila verticillata]
MLLKMTASRTPPLRLRIFRLFLAFLGLVVLGLNIQQIVGHKTWHRGMSRKDWFAALVVPDISIILMFLLLAVGRPRLISQKMHSICRILSSLMLIIDLLYHPAAYFDIQAWTIRWMDERCGRCPHHT